MQLFNLVNVYTMFYHVGYYTRAQLHTSAT